MPDLILILNVFLDILLGIISLMAGKMAQFDLFYARPTERTGNFLTICRYLNLVRNRRRVL
jgi:hypothetical protein